jgi:hypothetical protein
MNLERKSNYSPRKIIRLLQILQYPELRQLRWYMMDPSAGLLEEDQDKLISLIDLYPQFPEEKVLQILPPRNQQIHHAASRMLAVVESFIAFRGFKNNPLTQHRFLIERLSKENNVHNFNLYAEEAARKIKSQPSSIESLFNYYLIQKDIRSHWGKSVQTNDPESYTKYLLASHTFKKAFDLQTTLSYNSLARTQGIQQMQLPEPDTAIAAFIALNEHILQLQTSPDPDLNLYRDCIAIFIAQYPRWAQTETSDLLALLLDYGFRWVNRRVEAFRDPTLDFFFWSAEAGQLAPIWQRAEDIFLNICLMYLPAQGMDGVNEMLLNRLPNHPGKDPESFINTIRAFHALLTNHFQDGLKYLNRIKSVEHKYQLRVQGLLIRFLYDEAVLSGNYAALFTALASYIRYISRKRVLHEGERETYRRLHYFIKNMALRKRSQQSGKRSNAQMQDLLLEIDDPEYAKPLGYAWVIERLRHHGRPPVGDHP